MVRSVRRRDKRVWIVSAGIFSAVFLFTLLALLFNKINTLVDAADLAKFDPGYIISDFQMSNYNSMSEADIQSFLTSKNSCNNTDYGYYLRLSANKNYTWHWANGHFVCLSEERFGDADNEIGTGETAAHIIWQAAQDYQINPQALIVLIQKETGLITDKIPNNLDYRKATGYGCPDTAACSSKYYGFKNQVRNAAYLYRYVLDNGSKYYPVGNNIIKYHPNDAYQCGSSWVNIRNRATSALYQYTPYQPNAAALAAGYGEAPCGSYGNRNFYLYFEDWFGGITSDGVVEAKTKYERNVADGTYKIVPLSYTDRAIDMVDGVKKGVVSGALQTFSMAKGTESDQLFEIKYDTSNGYYSIVSPYNYLALDIVGAKTANSTRVQVYTQHNRCNQDWLFEKDDDGYYTIRSRCSGRVLDAAPSGNLVIFDSHGGDNQKWKLIAADEEAKTNNEKTVSDDEYMLVSKQYSDKVIDIKGGIKAGATSSTLQIFTKKDSNYSNQLFKIAYESGYYSITNAASGLAFDVKGASKLYGAGVQLFTPHGNCNQDWLFEKDGEGYYVIRSRCSSKVITTSSNNDLTMQMYDGSNEQKWSLVKVSSAKQSKGQEVISGQYQLSPKSNLDKAIDLKGGLKQGIVSNALQTFAIKTVGLENQTFEIKYDASNGYYSIVNPYNGLAFDVAGGRVDNSTRVQAYAQHDKCNQDWLFEKDSEGYYTIKSVCSGRVLDAAPSGNLVIFDSHGGNNQKWKLIRK